MSSPRFDGFYHDGIYFEAVWDDRAVNWSCHHGCSGHLEVSMAQLESQKLGTISLRCPSCHSEWHVEISSLSKPICADIMEVGLPPSSTQPFFSSR